MNEPQRLHPLTLVLGPLRVLRGWLVPLVIAFAIGRGGGVESLADFAFVFALVGFGVLRQVLEVVRVRWWMDGEAFQMRVGILQLESRSVPIERIQNVDITEPLIARFLGLAEVKIETAGSGGGDLALRYISLTQAQELREALIARAGVAGGGEQRAVETLVQTDLGELLIAGATANRIGALLVLMGAAWGWALEVGVDPQDALTGAGDVVVDTNPVALAGLALVTMVLVGWVVSIGATVLRYHGFLLTQDGEDLRREHGLLSRSSGLIPLKRVQAVRIERPWLRRVFHRASIVADTAGSVAAATDTGSGVVAPIIGDGAVARLAERVLGIPIPPPEMLLSVSRLAIRRGFVRVAVPIGFATLALLAFRPRVAWAPLLLLPLAYGWALLRYRSLAYRVDGRLVMAQAGVLTRRQWLVPTAKVQSTVVRSSLFQRRLGLATLSLDTAGPGTRKVTVIDLPVDDARSIAADLSALSALTGLDSDGV